MGRRGEFDLIAQLFAPLSDKHQGLGLTDDAALFVPRAGHTAVLTTDTLVAGIHFLPGDPPGELARKALRVNLSDLAAMGATPRGYLLNLAIQDSATDDWLNGFAAGLAADQHEFDIALLGGDTVRTPGPGVISITAIGEVRVGRALLRSGARVGDDIYVSGTIGDAAAGLRLLTAPNELNPSHAATLIDRYRLPRPRTTLGPALVGLATAAIDVSDGLIADLNHICQTSGVSALVGADLVPLSPAIEAAIADGLLTKLDAFGGGDDYEILFCAPREARDVLNRLAARLALPLTAIGEIGPGSGVQVLDHAGATIRIDHPGHTHF
ncbi:MAG: thiamine-phosphate kinase [Proteobacteria bacterium]|nr:thiamine-phosphate kinase [Pseudomonadota bacterium]MDA1059289.1 thiamine-phosphate kinase [Pseudomonadota bacterium]